jgi:hypothetical protein
MRTPRIMVIMGVLSLFIFVPAGPAAAHLRCSHHADRPFLSGGSLYSTFTILCKATHYNYSITVNLERYNQQTKTWVVRVTSTMNPACTPNNTPGCGNTVSQVDGSGTFRTTGSAFAVSSGGNITHVGSDKSTSITI